jgi:DNA-binding CsgD family transcriptional regulator
MKRSSGRDVSAVLEFLREIYAQPDVNGFVQRAVDRLPRLIAADMSSFNEVDPETGRYRTVVAPPGADLFPQSEEIFERHVREHPYVVNVRRFEDGEAHTLSEFVSHADFRRSAIYNEYYRHTGTQHQLAIAVPGAEYHVRGFALNRGRRDFSAAERRLLSALGPHLVQAHRNAELLARARPDGPAPGAPTATDVEVVLLSSGGTVQFATPRARSWLAAYFGASRARDGRLPGTLTEWLSAQAGALEGGDGVPPPRRPFVVGSEGARLEIRLAEWGQRALLVRERRPATSTEVLVALGLSPREAQVLAWVAEGKTNGEIGIILGARPRTVAKHLERIFRKLGVETRTAAASVVNRPSC